MTTLAASLLARLVGALVRYRLAILVASGLVTLLAVFPASRLQFDQTVESLFADDDPHRLDYAASKALFGGDELVGVVYRDPHLFESEGLERLRALAEELSHIPGVQAQSTQSLVGNLDDLDKLNAQLAKLAKIARLAKSLFKTEFTPLPPPDEIRRQAIELVRGILVGDDDQTTAVVLRLAPEDAAPCPRGETIAAIRDLAKRHEQRSRLASYVVGEPVQVHDMFRYVQEDGSVLGWTSTALLLVVILVLFRNLRWMVLPILIVQATLLWTKAILVLSGIKLTMVSSILESLVTIMGVATVMHMSLVYCELRPKLDRVAALQRTLELLAVD